MIVVQHRHLRALGYCNKGARVFCQRHGIDWSQIMGDGVPVETIIATGDAMAIEAAQRAKDEWAEKAANPQ